MKKFRSQWLVASFLGWLLALGPLPAGAYYPPLQATGSASGGGFSFSVTYPWGGGKSATGGYPPGVTVSNFTSHHGVMAWCLNSAGSYAVEYCTFDPFLDDFIFGREYGPFTEVTQLTVQDGVVAFVGKEISNTDSKFFYSTYDPAKGAWQNQSCLPISPETAINHDVITKDGVLAFYYETEIVTGKPDYNLEADIYDPVKGQWFSEFSGYSQEAIFGPDWIPIGNVSIANATISYDWFIPVGDPLPYKWSYDLKQHKWYEGQGLTKAGAYFVAQPSSGSSPLRVWFTDMSIGGTSWSWQFGDGGTSTSRSPYHSFTKNGIFPVTQEVTGNGSDTYTRNITVGPVMNPTLYFLLGD